MYHKWQSYDVWFLRYWAQCTTDRFFFVILDHFLPFYNPNNPKKQNFEKKNNWRCHFIHVYHKWQLYYVWFLTYRAWQTDFFIILDQFCPFTILKTQKIKILKKWKKTPGDIIILHKCTKNHDHMLYCSWDITHDRCNCYFSIWAFFPPFTS